jgi:hypothetical protein
MSQGGRAPRDLGEAFENQIDTWHEMAGLRGVLAHVVHNAPPCKVVNGRLIWEKPGVADYTGVLHGGRYLAAEAKSVAPGKRLAKSRVSPKQQKHLNAVVAAGGLALLLVQFRVKVTTTYNPHHHYAIPWSLVPWKVLRSAESLDEIDVICIEPYRVEGGKDYLQNYTENSPNRRYFLGERRKGFYPTE